MIRVRGPAACLCVLVAAQSATAGSHGESASALLDGDCSEYSQTAAELSHGVTAHIRHDAEHVWLCFDLPEGSFAGGEFTFDTPELETPLVLHVSAQLGQWPLGNDELEPQTATSELWWNNRGWAAIPARFNGMEEGEDGPQPRFLPASGQEFQFARAEFGPGPWTLSGGFYAVNDGAGGRAPVSLDDANGKPLVILRED